MEKSDLTYRGPLYYWMKFGTIIYFISVSLTETDIGFTRRSALPLSALSLRLSVHVNYSTLLHIDYATNAAMKPNNFGRIVSDIHS